MFFNDVCMRLPSFPCRNGDEEVFLHIKISLPGWQKVIHPVEQSPVPTLYPMNTNEKGVMPGSNDGSTLSSEHFVNSTSSDEKINVKQVSRIKLSNPLAGMNDDQVLQMADTFARENDLEDIQLELRKGALVSRAPAQFESLPLLDEDDKIALRREVTHKVSQKRYFRCL